MITSAVVFHLWCLLCLAFFPSRASAAYPPLNPQSSITNYHLPTLPRFEPADCPSLPEGFTIECGYLVVPEDRSNPASPEIRLAVAVVKSQQPNPAPDPLVFVNGGPGAHAMMDLPRFIGIFRLLIADQNRDVIIFDQRGVGLSQPALECPELAPMLLQQAHGETLTLAEIQAPYLACRDRWTSAGVNLAAYTTADSAADINDLWRTLGYSEVNLYGVSYGTVLAQTVMRDYPDGIRSVALDSPYPLEISLSADTAPNIASALQRIFAACRADLVCRSVYPNLEDEYHTLLDQLNRAPVPMNLTDPVSGKTYIYPFGAADLLDMLRLMPARQVPALIYDVRDGDLERFVESAETGLDNLHRYGAPPGRAMAYSVMCSQGLYSATPEQMAASEAYPESVWANRFIYRDLTPLPCDEWPSRGRDSQPAISDIPALVLMGEYDATLSPGYARRFEADLSRSVIVSVPNAGHATLTTGGLCVNTLARAFFDDPSRPLDTACLPSVNRPILDTPFVTRAAASRPPALALIALMAVVVAWAALRAALRLAAHPTVFAVRHALRGVSWLPALIGVGIVVFGLTREQNEFLWVTLPRVLETVIVPIVALQAALLFSPEDEPALEVTLASPRPLAVAVLERLIVLAVFTGGAGLALSLWTARVIDEPFGQIVARWLSPALFFCGLALFVTFLTRRAVLSFAIVSLLWFAASIFGEAIVKAWPFAWPLVPYLQPDHSEFVPNRWLIALAGLSLLVWSLAMLRDEERLLLGSRSGGVRRAAAPGVSASGATVLSALDQPPLVTRHSSPFLQFAGMVFYEFRLQWRRRSISVILLAMIALPVLGALTLGRQAMVGVPAGLDPAKLESIVTEQMRFALWGSLWGFLTLLVPVVAAETIPKDKHLGVRELLDSYPLSPGVYLAGKVAGMWAALLVGLGLGVVVVGTVWWLAVGPFDLRWYAQVWLFGALPLALINPSLGLLLAAGQPTQRRALLVGIGFAATIVVGQVIGFMTLDSVWSWINPGRPIAFLYFLGDASRAAPGDPLTVLLSRWITPEALAWTIVAGFAQVAAVGAIAWQWSKRQRQ